MTYGSPDFYQALTDSDVGALDSLRLAISTTAPLPAQLAANFARRFNKNLNPALGVIEVGLLTINTRPDKIGSVGLPMPAYSVTLVEENGKPVKPGEIGELHVKGPGLLNAYLAPWRPVNLLLKPHGYPTGDFAWVDPDGYLFLAGREKNRLQISGVQFFCEEVESILNTLPGIEESRVFLDSTSQTLSAEVVGSPGPTEQPHRIASAKDRFAQGTETFSNCRASSPHSKRKAAPKLRAIRHPILLSSRRLRRNRTSGDADLKGSFGSQKPRSMGKKQNQLDQRGNTFWGPIELVENHIQRLTLHQLIFFDIFIKSREFDHPGSNHHNPWNSWILVPDRTFVLLSFRLR